MSPADDDIEVGYGLTIPLHEIEIRTSRSGGPGGQHANKVETQVEVRWDLESSAAIGETRRRRLREALASRLVGGTVLVVRSRAERSQSANRRTATERLRELVARALRPRKRRRPTRPTLASRERRLAGKRRRSERKRQRARPAPDE